MADTTHRPRGSHFPVILALLLAAAAGITWRYFHTYHFAAVQPGVLYRDGNHSPAEFAAALRRVGPKTVISLVDDEEMAQPQFQAERVYCQAHGIDLVRIPINLGGWPTDAQVQEFLRIASDKARQPVLVHCAQGVRRTGMMTAAYQESILGYDPEQAKAAVLSFGHSEHTIADVRKFIDGYDPKTRRVSATLPATGNE